MFENARSRHEVQPCLLARRRTGLKRFKHEGHNPQKNWDESHTKEFLILGAPSWSKTESRLFIRTKNEQ